MAASVVCIYIHIYMYVRHTFGMQLNVYDIESDDVGKAWERGYVTVGDFR